LILWDSFGASYISPVKTIFHFPVSVPQALKTFLFVSGNTGRVENGSDLSGAI